MLYDNTGHIFHAAVANFDCVSENLVEFVFFGEVFIDESEESFCNVGLDIFAVWRVEPYYLSFLFLFRDVLFRSFVHCIRWILVFPGSTVLVRLVNKNFPKKHKFQNIFNRSTVKVSYSMHGKYGQYYHKEQENSEQHATKSRRWMQLQEKRQMPAKKQLPNSKCDLQSLCQNRRNSR